MGDVVGHSPFEVVFLLGGLEGDDMLALAAHIRLHSGVVYGHYLA